MRPTLSRASVGGWHFMHYSCANLALPENILRIWAFGLGHTWPLIQTCS